MSTWKLVVAGCWALIGIWGCTREPHGRALDLLQNAHELAAAEFVLSKVIIADQHLELLHAIPLNTATFFADSEAILVTGIDLGRIQPEHITVEGSSIRLLLPPVQVLAFEYPPGKCHLIHRYAHLHALGDGIHLADVDRILQQAQTQIMEAINHLPIRETTETKVAEAVRALLRQSEFSHVEVGFSSSTAPLFALPDTTLHILQPAS